MIIWTEARIEELKALIAAGNSGTAAGAAMGVSKNTALAKARSLGLKLGHRRAESVKAKAAKKGFVFGGNEPKPSKPIDYALFAGRGIALTELIPIYTRPGTCRWPLEAETSCGEPIGTRIDGSPSVYCQRHHALAHSPSLPLRRVYAVY